MIEQLFTVKTYFHTKENKYDCDSEFISTYLTDRNGAWNFWWFLYNTNNPMRHIEIRDFNGRLCNPLLGMKEM